MAAEAAEAAGAMAATAATYSLANPGCPLRELKRGPTTPPPERWCDWTSYARTLSHMRTVIMLSANV